MSLYKWFCGVVGCSSVFLVNAAEMKLEGRLIESACTIEYQDREQWIDFGELTVRDILSQSGNNLRRLFHIRLSDCTLASKVYPGLFYHSANITFIGDQTSSDSELIEVKGDAKGFGIRLNDINGTILTIGKATPDYSIINGVNMLNFTATIVPTSNNIHAGNFYATVHFFMDYL